MQRIVQGHLAPSSSDSGTSGSLVYDFYWGACSLRGLLLTPADVLDAGLICTLS